MQKQKINNSLYLTLQSTYENIEASISKNDIILDKLIIHKFLASKELIPKLKSTFNKHKINLNNLNFIAVNNGPAPFTSLRVAIATANGLAFALNKPLVQINGLESLFKEQLSKNINLTNNKLIILLNAYNQDIYYAINKNNNLNIGCEKIDLFFNNLNKNNNYLLSGNLINLFTDKVLNLISKNNLNIEIIKNNLEYSSIEFIAKEALTSWNNKINIVTQVEPLYIKPAI